MGIFTIIVLLPIAVVLWPFQLVYKFLTSLGEQMSSINDEEKQ
jgi:hypothetical protein